MVGPFPSNRQSASSFQLTRKRIRLFSQQVVPSSLSRLWTPIGLLHPSRSFARSHLVPSPTPLTHFASPLFIRLLDQLQNQFVASSSASQLRLKLRCRFLGWSGECAQTYRICTQLDNGHSHNHRITEGAKTEVRRHSQTRSSAAGDRDHQPQ